VKKKENKEEKQNWAYQKRNQKYTVTKFEQP
jgi:hypothetical protein